MTLVGSIFDTAVDTIKFLSLPVPSQMDRRACACEEPTYCSVMTLEQLATMLEQQQWRVSVVVPSLTSRSTKEDTTDEGRVGPSSNKKRNVTSGC